MQNSKQTIRKIILGLGFLALTGITGRVLASPVLINGAGATFPYPIYSKWFSEYQKSHPNAEFNYQSIGSGGGIQQITAKTVDFGASDAPMSDDSLEKVYGTLLHIPTVLGAVVIAYNAPIGSELKLDGTVIADIFLGKIKKWNDEAIAKLNPAIKLPNQDIFVAYRSDGSGTSYVFTDYLSKVSSDWKKNVGTGKSVKWPVGLGAKGNEGVTGLIKQTPGTLGYVELNYAIGNNLAYASVVNKTGQLVKPSVASVSAAADGALSTIPGDYRVSITNADGAESYPISSFTYLLIYKKQTDEIKGKALVDFLKWAMSDGQKIAPELYYAPLPASLISKINETIGEIKTP